MTTQATPPLAPDEFERWLTQVVAYLAGELPPEARAHFEAELPSVPAGQREALEEVRVLYEAVAAQPPPQPGRDLWSGVRAVVQADLDWLTAVRQASGEQPGGVAAPRKPAAELQTSVAAVFAAAAEAPRPQPSRDLLAGLRAEVQRGGRGHGPTAHNTAQPDGGRGGRVLSIRAWLAMGAAAAAAAVMLALGLGIIQPRRPAELAENPPTTTDNPERATAPGRADRPQTPEGEPEREGVPGEDGTPTVVDADSRHELNPHEWPPQTDPSHVFVRFDWRDIASRDSATAQPDPALVQPPLAPETIRFQPALIEEWPLPFDVPHPPRRLVLPAGLEGAVMLLPTSEGNLHLRRGRERGVLEVYTDRNRATRLTIRRQGRLNVWIVHRGGLESEAVQVPYSLRFIHNERIDAWYATSGSAMVTTTAPGGRTMILLDGDVNGRFDDVGADLVLLKASPSAVPLSELVRAGRHVLHLSVMRGGLSAEVARYRGPTGELTVHGAYREGVGLEYVHLRSDRLSFVVQRHEIGQPLALPPGRYELVHGRVGDGEHSVWVDSAEVRDVGKLVSGLAGRPLPEVPSVEVVPQQPAQMVLGRALRLLPLVPDGEWALHKRIPMHLALLGQQGERYRPVGSWGPLPLLPARAELREHETGEALETAVLIPTGDELLPFIAVLLGRGLAPGRLCDVWLVEETVSRLLTGAATEVTMPLR